MEGSKVGEQGICGIISLFFSESATVVYKRLLAPESSLEEVVKPQVSCTILSWLAALRVSQYGL